AFAFYKDHGQSSGSVRNVIVEFLGGLLQCGDKPAVVRLWLRVGLGFRQPTGNQCLDRLAVEIPKIDADMTTDMDLGAPPRGFLRRGLALVDPLVFRIAVFLSILHSDELAAAGHLLARPVGPDQSDI